MPVNKVRKSSYFCEYEKVVSRDGVTIFVVVRRITNASWIPDLERFVRYVQGSDYDEQMEISHTVEELSLNDIQTLQKMTPKINAEASFQLHEPMRCK